MECKRIATELNSLSGFVRVKPGFLRSVNLRRDANSERTLDGYVLSANALGSLERIVNGLRTSQRAWTLTGPYGSGKSAFALLVASLLYRKHPAHSLSFAKLDQAAPDLAREVGLLPDFLPVLAVGRRASPSMCLLDAIVALPSLPEKERAQINECLNSHPADSHVLDDLALACLEQLAQGGEQPLLIVLDEMGKTLEYAALHPISCDLYLLQQLAEMAPRWNLLFLGILHQTFEAYAHVVDKRIYREWTKVQGRFEDVPFIESPEQMMRLVAYALESDRQVQPVQEGRILCREIAEEMATQKLTPAWLRPAEFVRLAEEVYPLHPMALVLLPHLFRHYAQNERSLFAFLTMHEPFGLQQFLSNPLPPSGKTTLLGLDYLYDYVTVNFRHAVYTRPPLRPIAEVEQILLNGACSEQEVLVLKNLAMLQWASEVCYLQAKQEALYCAVKPALDGAELEKTLHHLRQRSVIVYRSFNRTFRVWKGSDVDIEELLQDARRQIWQQVSPAIVLQRLVPPLPVVARKHTYETGTLRVFEKRYVDEFTLMQSDTSCLLKPSEPSFAGVVAVCLPGHESQIERFEDWARSSSVAQLRQCVIGIPRRGVLLQEMLTELACLDWVQKNTPTLRDDPVARREVLERMDLVTRAINEQLQMVMFSCRWFYEGEDWTNKAQRSLSSLLSAVCDRLFTHTPTLRNELINRWALSSAAVAGRRNLIQAILEHPHDENLGIKGFPPERSMYESVLRDTGVHVPSALGWRFESPSADNPHRLHLLWEQISCRIFSDPPKQINVAELLNELTRPPYGITPGVFPVILCAFLKVYEDETSLYREGTFLPEPGIADWEVLLRRPELFEVAGCRTEGANGQMLQLIAKHWGVPPKTVPVVRELVRRFRQLPDHAKRTKRLSASAMALRQAILQAQSPERLLYHDIPHALGVPVEQVEHFYKALDEKMRELQTATPLVITWAMNEFLRACGLPEGADGWREFRKQATALRRKVLNPQLAPLLLRASYSLTGGAVSDEASLESVLALIVGRPPRAWTDLEVERFPEAAFLYGEAFKQAVLLASQEIVLTPQEEEQRDVLLQRLRQVLSENHTPRVKLSALIHLIDEGTKSL